MVLVFKGTPFPRARVRYASSMITKRTVVIVVVLLSGLALVELLRPAAIGWEYVQAIDGETFTLEVNASDGWSHSDTWNVYIGDEPAERLSGQSAPVVLKQDEDLNLLFVRDGGEVFFKLPPLIHDSHKAVYYFPARQLVESEGRLWLETAKTGYSCRINGIPIKGRPLADPSGNTRFYYIVRNKRKAPAKQDAGRAESQLQPANVGMTKRAEPR